MKREPCRRPHIQVIQALELSSFVVVNDEQVTRTTMQTRRLGHGATAQTPSASTVRMSDGNITKNNGNGSMDLLTDAAAAAGVMSTGRGKASSTRARVSFSAQEEVALGGSVYNTHGLSIVLPNKPINKDHRTLLDTLAEIACEKGVASPSSERRVSQHPHASAVPPAS